MAGILRPWVEDYIGGRWSKISVTAWASTGAKLSPPSKIDFFVEKKMVFKVFYKYVRP
jgi:hypothetical protein